MENNDKDHKESNVETAPTKLFVQWIQYLRELHKSCIKGMVLKELKKDDICAYLRHLPIKGVNEGWPEQIYTISDIIIHELYTYSKEMDYIPRDMDFKDFVKI